jgi:hypothetical protein
MAASTGQGTADPKGEDGHEDDQQTAEPHRNSALQRIHRLKDDEQG